MSHTNNLTYPDKDIVRSLVAAELEWVKSHVAESGLVQVNDIQTFAMTAPGPSPETEKSKDQRMPIYAFSAVIADQSPQRAITQTLRRLRFVRCWRSRTRSIL